MIGTGIGIPSAFAADFAAGAAGSALEQLITGGSVDAGGSILAGAQNALGQLAYGTGELTGVGNAFARGARTGAVSAALDNLADAFGIRGGGQAGYPGSGGYGGQQAGMTTWPGTGAGRDPRRLCGAPDPFNPWNGLGDGNTRGYQYGRNHSTGGTQESGGFSLGGFVRDTLTGAVIGGLGSAGFYGAGRAVEVLRGSVGRSRGGTYSAGDATFMDSDDSFLRYIQNRADVDANGYYDIIAHGTPNGIQITHNGQHMIADHRTAARLIQNMDGYNGQGIRLLSCNTGALDNGFAQNLANQLNVEVYAPTNYLWATQDGNFFVAGMTNQGGPNMSELGIFRVFIPGGSQ